MSVLRIAVLILAGLALMAQEPVRPAGKGVNFFSLEKEAALGRQLAAEFRKLTRGRRHTPSEVLLREGRDER